MYDNSDKMKERLLILAFTFLGCQSVIGQTLEDVFKNPPVGAKPIMIWQWMDGVISKEGITADLEAYQKAGIGGVQNFQVGGTAQGMVKDTTNAIGSEPWQRLMQFAISECHRLGLSFGTHNCPGWSSSAYPSVKPEYAMQKLVWTMVESQGTRRIRLEQPEAAFGYYEDIAAVAVPCDSIVRNEQIIIAPDAATVLLPKGRWRVYRFGHTANGKTNGSTSPESGVGLECDKMSREAVAHYWSGYPAMLMSLAGEETGTTFQRLEIDSYEAGGQEWTRRLPEEFLKRRGYDILKWLPALAGTVIDNRQATEQFMRDWRETVSDLFAENYYGYMSQLAHEHGLQLLVQPYGTGSAKPFNPINTDKIVRQLADDDPICAEFWAKPTNWGWKDIPRVVNAARRVGHEIVYAEGFTCWPLHAWRDDPARLKALADSAFCMGVNKLMLHAAAHNPWVNARPGMTFGMWGTWWTPGQTWWKNGAGPLFSYFARCQALLQKGRFIDDFKGKEPSLTADTEGIQWIHRKDGEADIYFIANAKDNPLTPTVTIAGTGRTPELWDPETGETSAAPRWSMADGKTQVRLDLTARRALFLILKDHTTATASDAVDSSTQLYGTQTVGGPWTVAFADGKRVEWPSLMPWNESTDNEIKYFSGTACYSQQLHLKSLDRRCRYILDLGEVKNLAVVRVNGKVCATLWHSPFTADITNALHGGNNTLEIDVTNLWVNRMVGDEQEPDDVEWSEPMAFGTSYIGRFMKEIPSWLRQGLPRPTKRKTVVSMKFFDKDTPLLRSGLIGPVALQKRVADATLPSVKE